MIHSVFLVICNDSQPVGLSQLAGKPKHAVVHRRAFESTAKQILAYLAIEGGTKIFQYLAMRDLPCVEIFIVFQECFTNELVVDACALAQVSIRRKRPGLICSEDAVIVEKNSSYHLPLLYRG